MVEAVHLPGDGEVGFGQAVSFVRVEDLLLLLDFFREDAGDNWLDGNIDDDGGDVPEFLEKFRLQSAQDESGQQEGDAANFGYFLDSVQDAEGKLRLHGGFRLFGDCWQGKGGSDSDYRGNYVNKDEELIKIHICSS